MLEEDNVRNGYIEQSDYERLRAKLPEYSVPLLVVGYHVGCRLGELLKLRWEQVDFNASQIWLEKRQTKAKVARVLPIYGDMHLVLLASLGERQSIPELQPGFPSKREQNRGFPQSLDQGLCRGRITWLRFHDLRPSAVRNMDRAGVPRATIAESSVTKRTPCSIAIASSISATFTRRKTGGKYLRGEPTDGSANENGDIGVTNLVTNSSSGDENNEC
jgi:integrase